MNQDPYDQLASPLHLPRPPSIDDDVASPGDGCKSSSASCLILNQDFKHKPSKGDSKILSISSIILGLAMLAGVTATPSAGCGQPGLSSGMHHVSIQDQPREYISHVPEGYDANTPYRLVFTYHWMNSTMQDIVDLGSYGLEPLSQGSDVFVSPNGRFEGWANCDNEDIEFTDGMLDAITGGLCIDETQIFATGFSYGGSMSFSAACSRPEVFRAIAPIGAAEISGSNGGTTPVAYLGFHGIIDTVLPLSDGLAIRDHFLSLNGCRNQEIINPAGNSTAYVKTAYQCSGPPVW